MSDIRRLYEILKLRLGQLKTPVCPARLNVEFMEIPYTDNTIMCLDYERSRFSDRAPSKKYCPSCEYNGDRLRRNSNNEVKKGIVEIIQKVV